MAKKIYYGGFDRQDYKEWGQQGGRPKKFKDEAEKKRFYRQQKALGEGRTLRGYRLGRVRKKAGDHSFFDWKKDTVYCPKCNTLLRTSQIVYNRTVWEWKEQKRISPQFVGSCKNCGYEFSTRKTFRVALTEKQRKERSLAKKKELEAEEKREEGEDKE